MKRILTVLFAMVLATGSLLAMSAPAQAACSVIGGTPICGYLYHQSDGGYDDPIMVRCSGSSTSRYVTEGYSSTALCPDIDYVGVRANEQILCEYNAVGGGRKYVVKFDAYGWHAISNTFDDGFGCIVQRD